VGTLPEQFSARAGAACSARFCVLKRLVRLGAGSSGG
jgi:hypothetical protein